MNETFLIVEDEKNDAFFLLHAFKKAGLQNPVHVAEDGEDAIEYLSGAGKYADRSAFPVPALIFLDLKLPRLHGFDVLEWIRHNPELPPMVVVVWTSSHVDADIVRAYRLGANSYVVKPGNLQGFLDMAKDFRHWWLQHDALPPARTPASGLPLSASRFNPVIVG